MSLILNTHPQQHFLLHNFDKDIHLNKEVNPYIKKGSIKDVAKLIIASLKNIF